MADVTEIKKNPNPILKANFMNKLTFWWLKDLIVYGKNHDLNDANIYDVIPNYRCEIQANRLESAWVEEQNKVEKHKGLPSLWCTVIKTYGVSFLNHAFLVFIGNIIVLIQPFVLELIMLFFQSTPAITTAEAYAYATVLIISLLVKSISIRQGYFGLLQIGIRLKVACCALIYKKILRLSSSVASQNVSGSVINLMSNDVGKFEHTIHNLPYLVIVPMQMIMVIFLIGRHVGIIASIVGISLILLQTIPVQALFFKLSCNIRKKLALKKDNRLSLIVEVINGIRAIKMYAWEKFFEQHVHLARKQEIRSYKKWSYLDAIVNSFMDFTHRVALLCTIVVFLFYNKSIKAEQVIPIAQYLIILQTNIHIFFYFSDVKVSMKRIQAFLLLEEIKPNNKVGTIVNPTFRISASGVTAAWNTKSEIATLKNLSVQIADGKLIAIIGPVGSGKSSMLQLILGELEPISGNIVVNGKVSYASQEPWLINGSIKENIIFGQNFDSKRYVQVTEACALADDFSQLAFGDRTLVGQKGMALSGGQCARVSLARAVYRNADVYLFDDPLSAVDTRVANKLFHDCIHNLLKNKTRILVTHNTQYLSNVDEVIVLKEGEIDFKGSYEDLIKCNRFCYLSSAENSDSETLDMNVECDSKIKITTDNSCENRNIFNEKSPKECDEMLATGAVGISFYWKFITASGSYKKIILFLIFFTLNISLLPLFDYWLMVWTRNQEFTTYNVTNEGGTNFSENNILKFSSLNISLELLGAIITVILLCSVFKNILFCSTLLDCSRRIHDNMMTRLLKAPLKFFSMNPTGRIMNRFSEDTGKVDDMMPKIIKAIVNILSMLIPILIVNWYYLFPLIIILCAFVYINNVYVPTTQNLRRLESKAKSTVLSYAASSLAGMVTIRSCKAENFANKVFSNRQNRNTSSRYLIEAVRQGFGFWMDLLTVVFLSIVTYTSIAVKNDDTFSGFIGLSLMQLLNISLTISFSIRQVIETQAYMTSVERMFQYTELEQESSWDSESDVAPPKSWPNEGEIRFDQVYLRYSEDGKHVLKNLSFAITQRSKIGVVGRTGAGKSSLISAILRLANIEGAIYVDGVNIAKIGLHDLRKKISIIPQEPILFSGTLRKNLDPCKEFDDATLWSALEDVELKKTFNSLDQIIDTEGSNLSYGQRQLLCLARAIVRKNKILILDEATANVDSVTDALIQKTIRNKFKDFTVITIAHRLNTVMDNDMILVMDNGQVVEYDQPCLLLQKSDGYFYKLVRQTGNAAEHLINIAEKSCMEIR